MFNKIFPLIGQLHQDISMASFGLAPTSKGFSFEIWKLFHQFLISQKPLSVLLDTPVPTVFLDFELVGPFAACCPWHIMRHVSANVNVVRVWGPVFKVLVTRLTQKLYFHVDYSRRLLFGLKEHFLNRFFLWNREFFFRLIRLLFHFKVERKGKI